MQVHANPEIPIAFVITDADVRKIWESLVEFAPDASLTAKCADDTERVFSSAESLAKYENTERSEVRRLEFTTRSKDWNTRASLTLGERFGAPISLSIHGEEEKVSKLRQQLSDILAGCKPWYSRVARVDLFYVFLAIFWFVFMLADFASPSNQTKSPVSFEKAVKILSLLLAIAGFVTFVVWLTHRLKKRYFPVATFAIGQGRLRHEHRETVRWVVIVGFVVSLVSSIFATILLSGVQ